MSVLLPATISFEGWLGVSLSLPDDFDRDRDPIPDEALQQALRAPWDDFGVSHVHDVQILDD